MKSILMRLEFNDDELLEKIKEIEDLSDELKRKVSEFQMLLKTKALSAENTDSEEVV